MIFVNTVLIFDIKCEEKKICDIVVDDDQHVLFNYLNCLNKSQIRKWVLMNIGDCFITYNDNKYNFQHNRIHLIHNNKYT